MRVFFVMRFIGLLLTFVFFSSFFVYAQDAKNLDLSEYFGGVIDLEQSVKEAYPYAYYKACAKARKLIHDADYYEALKAYDALTNRYGKTIDIVIGRAEAYYYLGDYKISRRLFQQGMRFEGFARHAQWALVHYRLASIAYYEKNEDEFVSLLQAIIKQDGSDDASIRSIVLEQGLDAAISYFTFSPSNAYEAYRELGLYLIMKGKHEEGISYVLTALTMAVRWGIRDVIHSYDMSFNFSDLRYFFEELITKPKGRAFLQEAEVGRMLYALKHYFAFSGVQVHKSRLPLSNSRYVRMLLMLLDNKSIFSTAEGTESKAYYPVIRL